ncbi:MAG: DUF2934 domain-containing protein [Alphaproteobacteria bacterium]|nr:DUF2934 domain-containing protein [Alphaproteobacteria bacterium]
MVNNEQAIREAAYYLWQNAGCPNGQNDYFWAKAQEQLNCCKSCNKTTSTSSAKKSSTSAKKSSSTKSKK